MTKTKPKKSTKDAVKKADIDLSEDHAMAVEELSGHDKDEPLNVSETDDDENEGTGNGNLERSDDDLFKDK